MSKIKLDIPEKAQQILDAMYQTMEGRLEASPNGICPLDITLSFVRMCHTQSCGKCVPCRIGLGPLGDLLEKILDGEASMEDLELLRQTAESIFLSADCAIGYGAAELVINSLAAYEEDYKEHILHQHCLGQQNQPVPCRVACPAHVDIPGYLSLIADGRNEDAVRLIRKDNPFPASCGFVCEHPCEANCRRNMTDDAINICGLKRYAVEHTQAVAAPERLPETGKKIAIVGGGPGGLTAAYYLQLMGHQVTIMERLDQLGGMLRYGIPPYRLPRNYLDWDINHILSVGVETKFGVSAGKDFTLEDLRKQYDAVYLSFGAHTSKFLRIAGEESKGVISAIDMLRNVGYGNPPDFTGKTVVIIGGGNVAMDASRTAVRLGASKVYIAYRRSRADMPALKEEIEGAVAEGCELLQLCAPDHVITDENGHVKGLALRRQIAGPIEKGRPKPYNAPEPLLEIPCDLIISAIGQDIEWQRFSQQGVPVNHGVISAEADGTVTGTDGIFAGGDCVTGPATLIRSIAAGKVAAINIDAYLGYNHKLDFGVQASAPHFIDRTPCGRCNMQEREAAIRKHDFEIVGLGLSDAEAKQEALRCLRCDKFGLGALKQGGQLPW
ncbi:MAG: NAD(P)-binding protein [Succiniclasticum sp.]|nr:NAD(P)-binding protein [Succiniclasticum sp.]MDY6087027.1 NAD(P)-binding protein [Succiniclasticum sp.]